ncbi:UV radiation resistance-associated protein-like [Corticium candelabrum]|uniref:UV radiation resistance-associated protein-like n=1 Tax=Corticium candelabrum TaxID=121492 RepID=UPI002E256341|nr:UV radiation resistance-associated protein-like [Corticium candelabrum]
MSLSLRSGEHVDLPSQQRRLRHLRSISARNLTLSNNEDVLLDTYFTLHVPGRSQEFYRSEVIRQALNPDWAALDPHSMTNKTNTAIPAFQIKIWAIIRDDILLTVDWLVDLGALVYMGDRVRYDSTTCGPNSLIFGMFNGYYGAPPEHYSRLSREALEASLSLKTLSVTRSSTKLSYTKWNLLSLVEKCQQLSCLRGDISSLKEKIRRQTETGVADGNSQRQHELARVRIRLLKDDHDRQAIQERSESMALERLKGAVAEKASSLKQSRVELSKHETNLTQMTQMVAMKRYELCGTNARMSFRRCSLLCQLIQIFPIQKVDDHCVIVGIKLPNAGSYSGSDEDAVSAALGYVSQLVCIVSCILCVRLLHRMTPGSSFSFIRDDIRNDLEGEEREFQLFARTKSRERFGYGVFLVNDNIRQLRQNCGLPTNDMRITLHNILELLQLFSHHNHHPVQSLERDIPYFTQPLVPPSLADFSDPPPPYEAIASQQTHEHSPSAAAAAAAVAAAAARNPTHCDTSDNRDNIQRARNAIVRKSSVSGHSSSNQSGQNEDNRARTDDEEKQRAGEEHVRVNTRDIAPSHDPLTTEKSVETQTPTTANDLPNSDWTLDDVVAANRDEGKEEVSGHSPSLMRGKTRLAGIGFGAAAAARGLRPNSRPRQQRKPGRFSVNDQVERQVVSSIAEREDGREREKLAGSSNSDDGTRCLHKGRGDGDASDSNRTVVTTS